MTGWARSWRCFRAGGSEGGLVAIRSTSRLTEKPPKPAQHERGYWLRP